MADENFSYGSQTLDRSPQRLLPATSQPLSRAASLPVGIDGAVETPLAYLVAPSTFKPNSTGRCSPVMHSSTSAQKRAQKWRTSMAVTNSDYYSQWKPQISTLAMLHGSTVVRNVPRAASLDAISESESQNAVHTGGTTTETTTEDEDEEVVEIEDSGVFQYTPSRMMEDLASTHTGSIALQDLSYTNPITGGGAAVNNNGQHVQENGCEVSRQQPPVPNRRSVPPDASEFPSDNFNGILALMVLLLACLDLPAIMCLLPALACSLQVKKRNEYGLALKAHRWAEWSKCCCITAILFHVVFLLVILLVIFLIHFITDLF